MVDTVVRWIDSGQQAITPLAVDISEATVGETMLLVSNVGSTSVTMTAPAGWTALFTKTNLGTRACWGFYKVKESIDEVSVEFSTSSSTGWSWALLGVFGAAVEDWIIGPVWNRVEHGTSTTTVIDGVTTTSPNNTALVLAFEATSAAEDPNTIVGVNNDFVELGYLPQGLIIETIWAGTKSIPTAGDVGDVTVTYQNTQANNGAGLMIAFPQGPYIPPGLRMKTGDSNFVRVRYLDEEGVERVPASARFIHPGFNSVEQLINTPGATMAHRGGSEHFPEMSEWAYDQSILRGFGVLEFSAQRTSDGWWFGVHNPDLNEVTGSTGLPNISTMTRAEVEEYANVLNGTEAHPSQPFFGLDEFLDKYKDHYVLMVDPKNAIAYNLEFLSICDNIVSKERLIWKYVLGGVGSNVPSNAAQQALNRGWAATWGYGYNTDVDSGAFQEQAIKPAWTMLGMNSGADQVYWDEALSYGKPVVGHIARTQAHYNEAISKGADIVQCANTRDIQPVGP